MRLTSRSLRAAVSAAGAIMIVACDNPQAPLVEKAPSPPKTVSTSAAVKDSYEITGSIDDYLNFTCLSEPARLVVSYRWTFDVTTTPSGVSSVRSTFIVDREQSYVVYGGLTYYVTQGRPGHDDIIHYLYGPGGLYIEAGTEPDFEQAETGERLRLNFHWQIVIGQDGTARVIKVTGACPAIF